MQELGLVVSLEMAQKNYVPNDDGRLFAAITNKPNIDNPIERPAPINPIEGEASNELPNHWLRPRWQYPYCHSSRWHWWEIKDNGVTGGVIIGPEGTKTVSKATMDAYKQAAELLSIDEQKPLLLYS
ncbi:hypothetical protein O9993_15825 [Vibrio lentus]|nr:hypothetical protein [Vibrio lentus]